MLRNNFKLMLDGMEMSILEASRRTGLSRSVLGRMYRNETTALSFDTIDAVCKGLGVDFTDFLEYVPDPFMTIEDKLAVEERNGYAKKKTAYQRKYHAGGDE